MRFRAITIGRFEISPFHSLSERAKITELSYLMFYLKTVIAQTFLPR